MRDCPVCLSADAVVLWRSEFLVADGWTKPKYIDWQKCESCGMIYGNNDNVTQEDFNTYYQKHYGYGVVDEQVKYRLAKRAGYVRDHYRRSARIVDFGGGESGLKLLLDNIGFTDVTNYQVGDIMPPLADCIIAEHVLEHIYDLETAMKLIATSLKDGGMLIVDIPDAGRIGWDLPPEMPILDYHPVHINHFRVVDLLKLAARFGMELIETSDYIERFCGCRMFVFIKHLDIGARSREYVLANLEAKYEKLKELGDKEMIVWGLGDITMACLKAVKLNIKYYVVNDPAFKDGTIEGLPILELPNTDHPILIISQSQRQKLLDNIKKLGVKNEIIVI